VIQLEVRQTVSAENRERYDEVVRTLFVPAISAQPGFVSFRLLEEYSGDVLEEIGTKSDGFNLVFQLTFETEQHRRDWVSTPEHAKFGEGITGLIDDAQMGGYTIVRETK
jgi:heme-degrading monooxygenase HmoA